MSDEDIVKAAKAQFDNIQDIKSSEVLAVTSPKIFNENILKSIGNIEGNFVKWPAKEVSKLTSIQYTVTKVDSKNKIGSLKIILTKGKETATSNIPIKYWAYLKEISPLSCLDGFMYNNNGFTYVRTQSNGVKKLSPDGTNL